MRFKKTFTIIIIATYMFISQFSIAHAVSNKPIHWGFKKTSNEEQIHILPEHEQLLKKYNSFYKGDENKKEIYLTFDNGYENGYTEAILNILKKENVPATFFVTGHYLKSAEHLVKRMVADGHIIGNHSWDHPDLTTVSDERLKEELDKVKVATEKVTKQKGMSYLRPPRGIFSERTLKLSSELGYANVFWSLAFVDWNVNAQKGWEYSYKEVMKQIHPGAILLLHTVSKDNADALEKIIKDLKEKGYTFKSLDDLMMKSNFDTDFLMKK